MFGAWFLEGLPSGFGANSDKTLDVVVVPGKKKSEDPSLLPNGYNFK